MNISHSYTVAGSVDDVVEVLLSQELADLRMSKLSVGSYDFSREGDSATLTAGIEANKLPSIAQKFIRSDIEATVRMRRQGDAVNMSLDAPLPVSAELASHVVAAPADPNNSTVTVSGEVKVKIPLIGGRIESAIAEKVDGVLDRDAQLITEILAQR